MKRVWPAVVAALLTSAGPALAQCAMCQTALTGSPEGRAMMGQFNHAILLMLAAPYAVFASLVLVIFRRTLRERAAALLARIGSRRVRPAAGLSATIHP